MGQGIHIHVHAIIMEWTTEQEIELCSSSLSKHSKFVLTSLDFDLTLNNLYNYVDLYKSNGHTHTCIHVRM